MSDSNNEVEHYDWKSAWKLDDPEWVKERKKKWREVKSHYIMYIFDSKSKKYIQNYFLFGTAFPNGDIDSYRFDEYLNPIPVNSSLLTRVWMHPVHDVNAFENFKYCASEESSTDSLWSFRECLRKEYPDDGNMFDGRDKTIYRLLGPCRARRQDFEDDISYEEYIEKCLYRIYYLIRPLKNFLNFPYSEFNVASDLSLEWKDMVTPALEYCYKKGGSYRSGLINELIGLIKPSIKIIKSPDKYHSKQLEVAQEIINHLKTLDYPDKTKRLTDLLAKV